MADRSAAGHGGEDVIGRGDTGPGSKSHFYIGSCLDDTGVVAVNSGSAAATDVTFGAGIALGDMGAVAAADVREAVPLGLTGGIVAVAIKTARCGEEVSRVQVAGCTDDVGSYATGNNRIGTAAAEGRVAAVAVGVAGGVGKRVAGTTGHMFSAGIAINVAIDIYLAIDMEALVDDLAGCIDNRTMTT